MYIKRERYLEKIRPFYELDLIKVLTGVRRCGKSVLLSQIEEEIVKSGVASDHIVRVNFEDIQFEHIRKAEKLNEFFKTSYDDGTMMTLAETYGVQAAIIPQ